MRQSDGAGSGSSRGSGGWKLRGTLVDKLWMDLERQEALASRRGKVIAELKDEAYT